MSHDNTTGMDPHDPNGSPLEALLREDARYLGDDGFTERVMAALPPRAAGSRWRPLILAVSALCAALVGGFAVRALDLPLGPALAGPVDRGRLLEWLLLAFSWAPEGLPLGVPVVPLALGVLVLSAAFLWNRATSLE